MIFFRKVTYRAQKPNVDPLTWQGLRREYLNPRQALN